MFFMPCVFISFIFFSFVFLLQERPWKACVSNEQAARCIFFFICLLLYVFLIRSRDAQTNGFMQLFIELIFLLLLFYVVIYFLNDIFVSIYDVNCKSEKMDSIWNRWLLLVPKFDLILWVTVQNMSRSDYDQNYFKMKYAIIYRCTFLLR